MTDAEQQLLQLLTERSFKRGTFTLVSGATSSYYIDGRLTATHSAGAFLIGRVVYERTAGLNPDALGGMAVGAVPLATAAVLHYHLNGRAVDGFWVRDSVKEHGTRKLIEGGGVRSGARVVVLDDVITTGGSALKAIDAVREAGAEVVKVLALVDRLQGGVDAFRDRGVDYEAVFTIRDFGVEGPAGG
ncbi:MAG: orotate phosphoribosyltransferase [Gemmataceae bacterium]|nr:orotate phosphoribosyltransferase [Gemmataceae bacterium]